MLRISSGSASTSSLGEPVGTMSGKISGDPGDGEVGAGSILSSSRRRISARASSGLGRIQAGLPGESGEGEVPKVMIGSRRSRRTLSADSVPPLDRGQLRKLYLDVAVRACAGRGTKLRRLRLCPDIPVRAHCIPLLLHDPG